MAWHKNIIADQIRQRVGGDPRATTTGLKTTKEFKNLIHQESITGSMYSRIKARWDNLKNSVWSNKRSTKIEIWNRTSSKILPLYLMIPRKRIQSWRRIFHRGLLPAIYRTRIWCNNKSKYKIEKPPIDLNQARESHHRSLNQPSNHQGLSPAMWPRPRLVKGTFRRTCSSKMKRRTCTMIHRIKKIYLHNMMTKDIWELNK